MSDLDGKCFIKRGKALVPADINAEEFLDGLSAGKEVILSIRTPRSPSHHRFFFAFLKAIVDNTDNIWNDVDELLEAVKFAVGHTVRFRRIVNPHAQDLALADKIAQTALYCVNGDGNIVALPVAETAKIIMALRRGADEYVTRPKSINFASMSEDKFKEFHTKAVQALNIFLGWDTETLMAKKNEVP